jgi:hypothetical protein
MSNIYQDQARDFANIPILRRDVIACVHLEDKDDIVFWDAMLQNQRRGKYHYVTHSKSQSGKETSFSILLYLLAIYYVMALPYRLSKMS